MKDSRHYNSNYHYHWYYHCNSHNQFPKQKWCYLFAVKLLFSKVLFDALFFFFLCKAGESMMFNTFIQETKERLINQRGHEFWLLMVKGKIQSITDCFIVYCMFLVVWFFFLSKVDEFISCFLWSYRKCKNDHWGRGYWQHCNWNSSQRGILVSCFFVLFYLYLHWFLLPVIKMPPFYQSGAKRELTNFDVSPGCSKRGLLYQLDLYVTGQNCF